MKLHSGEEAQFRFTRQSDCKATAEFDRSEAEADAVDSLSQRARNARLRARQSVR